jgi:hypothetical protein
MTAAPMTIAVVVRCAFSPVACDGLATRVLPDGQPLAPLTGLPSSPSHTSG